MIFYKRLRFIIIFFVLSSSAQLSFANEVEQKQIKKLVRNLNKSGKVIKVERKENIVFLNVRQKNKFCRKKAYEIAKNGKIYDLETSFSCD